MIQRRINHFAAAMAMFVAIREAMLLPSAFEQQAALGEIGPYKSRGKGRGTPSKRYGNKAGAYRPHQGKREMERRREQRARDAL